MGLTDLAPKPDLSRRMPGLAVSLTGSRPFLVWTPPNHSTHSWVHKLCSKEPRPLQGSRATGRHSFYFFLGQRVLTHSCVPFYWAEMRLFYKSLH